MLCPTNREEQSNQWRRHRFETDTMVFTIVVIVLLVQLIQFSGSRVARAIDKR